MEVAKIKILDTEWEAKIAKAGSPELLLDSTECIGTAWYSQTTIYISDKLSDTAKVSTLLHELTHAYLAQTQLKQQETYTEEEVCQVVANYARAITRDASDILKQWGGIK